MPFVFLCFGVFLWVGLPAALAWKGRKSDRSRLPAIALATAVSLGLFALIDILPFYFVDPNAPNDSDTYYVVVPSYFLLNIAVFMLVLAGLTWAALWLVKGWLRAGIAPAFWVFHLGAGALALPFALERRLTPRRYIDLADHLVVLNHVSTLGAALTSVALLGLLTICVIGLGQKALGKGKA